SQAFVASGGFVSSRSMRNLLLSPRKYVNVSRFLGYALFAGLAFGQQYFGGLTGTVVDPSGAVLPNAVITLTNLNKGTKIVVSSNESGIYRAVNLVPDPYRIEAEVPGFKKSVREPLLVETNRTLTVDLQLEVGNVSDTISVTAA